MIQFFTADILQTGILNPEESQHCIRVLRKRRGDIIWVTDGKGSRYECGIMETNPKGVEVEILNNIYIPKGWQQEITLGVAPTKNSDRMSWMVEKAVEIGVDRIVFIKCYRSERKTANIERLKRIAISAMNQSLKTLLPEIIEMIPLDEYIHKNYSENNVFGYCKSLNSRKRFIDEFNVQQSIGICIGPEGDFSHEEVDMMEKSGFKAVTFGDERLRTETAAIYGLCASHVLYDIKK